MAKTEEIPQPDLNDVSVDDTSNLPSTWKKASGNWGHSLHRLAPYVGGFPPELAHYFIRWFSNVGDTVLDPFCGGGTAPLEAALHNRYAFGNDAFSYAYTLSHAKCNPMDTAEFKRYLDTKLTEAAKVENKNMRLLNNDDLAVFYSEYTLDKLLRLRQVLMDDSSHEALYLKAILCGILHGPSDMYLSLQTKDTYSGTADYVRDYAEEHGLDRPERDIRPRAIQNHNRAQKHLIPPWLSDRTTITKSDARELPYADGIIDLVVTSPPYMRVLDYTWNNWIRLWWLGDDRKKERENIDITADVEKYRQFMQECLVEMYRVMAPESIAVLVVGDVKKHLAGGPRTLNTAGIIAEEAIQHTGFEVYGAIADAYDIDNRGYLVFNQLKYDHDKSEKDKKARVPIDRCLILIKGKERLPEKPDIGWDVEPYKTQPSG